MPRAYTRKSKYSKQPRNGKTSAWSDGACYADCLRKHPMGKSKRRSSASNAGGASVGGGT